LLLCCAFHIFNLTEHRAESSPIALFFAGVTFSVPQ
jgi:hypothetical protein